MNSASVQRMAEFMMGEFQFNPTYWPYTMRVKWDQWQDAERFCYMSFKTRNWRNQGQRFAFKRKQDYDWFLLRWT